MLGRSYGSMNLWVRNITLIRLNLNDKTIMIKPIQMFTVICDNCGVDVFDGEPYSGYSSAKFSEEIALECDWIKQDDKHYCSDCVSYDEEGNLILKQLKETK